MAPYSGGDERRMRGRSMRQWGVWQTPDGVEDEGRGQRAVANGRAKKSSYTERLGTTG